MKLISCHIDAFGKFKNVDFVFNDGLQVFCEKNGFGKTTLAHFIKAMFYSLPPKSKKTNVKSERDLYKPIDYDGKFGGQLTFSCKKGEFIVFRQFGTTPTLDKFYLFDAKTKLISNEFSSNLGEELFGVGEETFENSTFFGQHELVSGINDDIRASLSTGVLSGDDVDNFDNAQDCLQKKIKEVRAEIKGLKVDDVKNELERTQASEIVLKNKLLAVEDEIKKINNELKTSKFSKKPEDATLFINQNISLSSVIEADKTRLDEKKQQREIVSKGSTLSLEDYKFLKDDVKIRRGNRANATFFVSILIVLLSVIGFILGKTYSQSVVLILSGVFLFCALTVITISLFVLRRCYDDMKHRSKLLKQYKLTPKKLALELSNFESSAGDIKFIDDEINNIKSKIEQRTKEKENLARQFRNIFGFDIENYYDRINQKSQAISSFEKKIIELKNDHKHFTSEYDKIQEKLVELTDNFDAVREKEGELQQKLDLLFKTSQILENARDSISKRYIEPVSNRFNKYYKQFLKDGEEIIIDSNLGLRFGSKFSDIDYLSSGLFDLVYICKRFALIDLLYKKENPVIILDDPFSNFDDEKLEIAKKLIDELKNEYQILLFTCQKARS